MILPDVNTLLYADPRGVAFAWMVLLTFLRPSTRRGTFPRPLSVDDALRVIENRLGHPRARVFHPGERHARLLGQLRNLTTDAHIAALAIEHGATVLSFDRDFARFDGVQWTLPTAN